MGKISWLHFNWPTLYFYFSGGNVSWSFASTGSTIFTKYLTHQIFIDFKIISLTLSFDSLMKGIYISHSEKFTDLYSKLCRHPSKTLSSHRNDTQSVSLSVPNLDYIGLIFIALGVKVNVAYYLSQLCWKQAQDPNNRTIKWRLRTDRETVTEEDLYAVSQVWGT